jgi:predicted Fe-Mo cluster-binding NifX family protein
MNVAIPVWQGRVSPVFDAARTLHLSRIGPEGGEEDCRTVEIAAAYPTQRVTQLMDLDVDVLVCGAVSAPLAEMIAASGIRLVAFVTGEVEDVLAAYLRGELPDPAYALPGCGGRGRRCRVRGRRGRR